MQAQYYSLWTTGTHTVATRRASISRKRFQVIEQNSGFQLAGKPFEQSAVGLPRTVDKILSGSLLEVSVESFTWCTGGLDSGHETALMVLMSPNYLWKYKCVLSPNLKVMLGHSKHLFEGHAKQYSEKLKHGQQNFDPAFHLSFVQLVDFFSLRILYLIIDWSWELKGIPVVYVIFQLSRKI